MSAGLLLAGLLYGAPTAVVAWTKADPAPFFERLASIGLYTGQIKRLNSEIEIFYRKPGGGAEAVYGYIADNIYVPWAFKEKDSRKIRFDLRSNEINTFLHEFAHAEFDVFAREKAPRGSVDYKHWEATNFIWSFIFLDKKQYRWGGPRYPRMKASEVASYYFGHCMMNLFQGASDLYAYNQGMVRGHITSSAQAEELGDRFILPPKDSERGWQKRVANEEYWKVGASDLAVFEGKPVHWDEQEHVKLQIYDFFLGLLPPRNAEGLVKRLNRSRHPETLRMRREIRKARMARARELDALAAAEADTEETPDQAFDELSGR